jgi:hypothetical protein
MTSADEDKAIAASWAALDKADEMALTKPERAAIHRKIIASVVFGADFDGIIDSLNRCLAEPRT